MVRYVEKQLQSLAVPLRTCYPPGFSFFFQFVLLMLMTMIPCPRLQGMIRSICSPNSFLTRPCLRQAIPQSG